MKWLWSSILVLSVGCAHFAERAKEANIEEVQRNAQAQDLHEAEDLLNKGRFEESEKAYVTFQTKYPQSTFYQASRLGLAQSFEGQGRFNEAVELNREIYLNTLRLQPEIAAKALYRSAFCYEAMGDDQKALAALLDAKNLGQHLPPEIALAEIPAKLSAIYARQDREKEALAYLNEAEKGLAKVMQERGSTLERSWLAQTYFQMGSISTNQLSRENFGSFAQGQMWVQSYLIKAMKLDDLTWSPRAQKKLIETYRSLFSLFESEAELAQQVQMGGDLYDLMDQAELFKPITGEKIEGYEKDFFATLTDIRSQSDKILYTAKETTGLTVESQKLNGLRRAGRVKADKLLPGEKAKPIPLPPKIVPSQDPNL
ncbi:hypothetical protein AZI86_05765 [Bdellovibrio bacteriovorus]|uniref:Uncharacterized protein n=1 Tax=Bdellovibrio bacteriovorus TaxID=959 RepID=A0A150WQ46_BDEBC|nr:tetratricopeptide repeat protein [Bdellovibrio bacteriovorus]KYG66550.1 hypothetical protein AZI86_05765 [Bdellovibrio bacteriovorus]